MGENYCGHLTLWKFKSDGHYFAHMQILLTLLTHTHTHICTYYQNLHQHVDDPSQLCDVFLPPVLQ